MTLARVVAFEGVTASRIDELRSQIEDQEPPPDLPATEVMVLVDREAEKSLAIVFFDNEEDYRRGHETLDAMPAPETPGRRTSVTKYEVAIRRRL
jgi:hypothetical protein